SKETPKALYRASGYRVCGDRAVRVDILERLADLIRPALAWREGAADKPAGAVDGRCFTVTQSMTSLTGSSGEDFGSILRALGYRMEKRPKPAEPPKAVEASAVGDTPPVDPALQAPAEGSDAPVATIDASEAGVAPVMEIDVVVEVTPPVAPESSGDDAQTEESESRAES